MDGELKIPIVVTPPPIKIKLTYEQRLEKMTDEELARETDRISRDPKTNKLAGAYADVILLTIFKRHNKGNDPYMLDSHSITEPFFEIRGGTRK